MNLAIFTPHEDKNNFTNRNLLYSYWSQKQIKSTLYVSNFNYKINKSKKLKYFFFEKEIHKGVEIYRIFSTPFSKSNILRFLSYSVFSILSLIIFFFIDKKKYSFVIGESVPPMCSFIAYLCSLKNNSQFVYQIRDPWPLSIVYYGLMSKNSLAFIFFEKINRFLIKKSNFIISALPYLEKHYKKNYNYKKKIYYLRNPAEVEKFKPKKYPSINGKIKIVFAGGFTPSFKIINFFEAIKNLQKEKRVFTYSYYFIGNGVDLEKCKRFTISNDLKDVYFLKSRSKKEVLYFISKCHLCIAVVSKNKNCQFGYNLNKIIDYTVCGRPILFTNNLKKNCFVEDNKMGFNTSPSPAIISSKLIFFSNLSFKKKKMMAANARSFAMNELNINVLYKKYFKIFSENYN